LESLLLESGAVSEDELRRTLAEGMAANGRLAEVALRRGWIDEAGLASLLARQWQLPFLSDQEVEVDPATNHVPGRQHVQQLGGCVIGVADERLLVAVADLATHRLNDIRAVLGSDVSFAVVTRPTLERLRHQAATHAPRVDRPVEPMPTPVVPPNDGTDALLADVEAANAALEALRERLEQRRQIEAELVTCRRQLDDATAQLSSEQARRRDLEQQLAGERERRGETTRMLAELLEQMGS
jgi:hypothetical protein